MASKVVAVVQARMGASRLPNKMMLWLNGYPVIEWIFKRLNMANKIDTVVYALPDTSGDDVLAEYLTSLGANTYRGPESDVLRRCVGAVSEYEGDFIVRICADNPLVSGFQIDRLIKFFEEGELDYAYNHIPKNNSYPDGLGAEIVRYSLLAEIDRLAMKMSEREHIFNYIWDNQQRFKIGTCDPLVSELRHPELKLDIDTIGDYQRLLKMKIAPDMADVELIAAALKNR